MGPRDEDNSKPQPQLTLANGNLNFEKANGNLNFEKQQQEQYPPFQDNNSIQLQSLDARSLMTSPPPSQLEPLVMPSENPILTKAAPPPPLENQYAFAQYAVSPVVPKTKESGLPSASVADGVGSQSPPRYEREPPMPTATTLTLPPAPVEVRAQAIAAPPPMQQPQLTIQPQDPIRPSPELTPPSAVPLSPPPAEPKPLTWRAIPSAQQQQQQTRQGVTSFVYSDQDDPYIKGLVAGKDTLAI